jgi:hypothetical protein
MGRMLGKVVQVHLAKGPNQLSSTLKAIEGGLGNTPPKQADTPAIYAKRE